MSEPDVGEALANLMLTLSDHMSTVREAVSGYRHQLIAEGFSEPAAEQMASQYHELVLHMLFKAGKK